MSSPTQNRRLVIWLFLIALGMFAFGYILVPIYSVLCKAAGINGKTAGATAASSFVDKTRTVTVEFTSTGNSNMAFQFYPLVKKIKVHPGENTRLAFFAKNTAGGSIIIQAIPSVTPGLAARHLKKTECFCFTHQYFKPGEERVMPILFHIDTDLAKEISTVTLSYTLFDVSKIGKIAGETVGKIH